MPRADEGTAPRSIWPAYLLWAAPFLLLVVLIWIVLKACGLTLLGFTLPFPWCSGPAPAAYALEREIAREAALRDRIHDAELALMHPDNCAPRVAPPPEQRAGDQCAPNQMAAPPREIMLVLDASGSMEYPISTPQRLERRLYAVSRQLSEAKRRGNFGSILNLQSRMRRLYRRVMDSPGPGRMAAAHDVLDDAIDSAPENIAIGLMSFPECGAVQNHGTYASGDRAQLKRELRSIGPEEGTPLAEAITQASHALQGGDTPEDHVNIVIISDGKDNCDGDPCAAAREAKARKPGLVINVVDLADFGELRCVAEATGGFYQQHTESMDLSQLAQSMREAAGYEGRGLCRE